MARVRIDDTADAVAAFLARGGRIERCPAVCAAPSTVELRHTKREAAELKRHSEAREAQERNARRGVSWLRT